MVGSGVLCVTHTHTHKDDEEEDVKVIELKLEKRFPDGVPVSTRKRLADVEFPSCEL